MSYSELKSQYKVIGEAEKARSLVSSITTATIIASLATIWWIEGWKIIALVMGVTFFAFVVGKLFMPPVKWVLEIEEYEDLGNKIANLVHNRQHLLHTGANPTDDNSHKKESMEISKILYPIAQVQLLFSKPILMLSGMALTAEAILIAQLFIQERPIVAVVNIVLLCVILVKNNIVHKMRLRKVRSNII